MRTKCTVATVRAMLSKLRDEDEFERTLAHVNQAVMRGNDSDGWAQVGHIDLVRGALDLYGEGYWEATETGDLDFTPSGEGLL